MPSPFDSLYKERPLCSSFPLNQGGNHPLPFSFDAKITLAISLQKILHPKGHAAAYAGSCRFGHNIFFSGFRSDRFELVLIPFIHTFEIYFAVNKDLLPQGNVGPPHTGKQTSFKKLKKSMMSKHVIIFKIVNMITI